MASFTVTIRFGHDDEALCVGINIEAASLEDAIEKGRKVDVWKQILRSGVSFDDGKPTVDGVFARGN